MKEEDKNETGQAPLFAILQIKETVLCNRATVISRIFSRVSVCYLPLVTIWQVLFKEYFFWHKYCLFKL